MELHHLRVGQKLEKMRQEIAQANDRPCYLASGEARRGTLYRKPGTFEYAPVTRSELFFSQWWDKGRCVKREDFEDKPSEFYYDLELSPVLRFYIPTTRADRAKWREGQHYDQFKSVGLHQNLNEYVTLWADDYVLKELEPFIEDHRKFSGPNRGKRGPAVTFMRSVDVATPIHRRPEWHLAEQLPGVKFRAIQSPGMYSGEQFPVMGDFNRMARVECDPGPCVVCRGAKGERVHIAPLYAGADVYPQGHVCRGCTAETFAQWQAILDKPGV